MINFSHLSNFPPSKPRLYKNIFKPKNSTSAILKPSEKNRIFFKIPSQNLPPIVLPKNKKKESPNKTVQFPIIKPILTKISPALLSSSDTRKNYEKSLSSKPEIGFFSFPKKHPSEVRHQKRKEKKEITVSSWANESNNILWTLPETMNKMDYT